METPRNPLGHVDLRVPDKQQAYAFYSKLLPAVGLTEEDHSERWQTWAAPGKPPSQPWFGYTEDPSHTPNANRISFWAVSRVELDRIAEVAKRAGAINISGPRECPEYSPTYYAFFFEDPFGNKLEVCHL